MTYSPMARLGRRPGLADAARAALQAEATECLERAAILAEAAQAAAPTPVGRRLCAGCRRELGGCAGAEGLYAEAVEHFERAVAHDGADARAHFALATAYSYQEDARSQAHYDTAADLAAAAAAGGASAGGGHGDAVRALGAALGQAAEEAAQLLAEVAALPRVSLEALPADPALWRREILTPAGA